MYKAIFFQLQFMAQSPLFLCSSDILLKLLIPFFFFWDFKHLSEILFRGNHFSFYLFKTFYAFMLPFPQLKQQLFVNCIPHFLSYDKIHTIGSENIHINFELHYIESNWRKIDIQSNHIFPLALCDSFSLQKKSKKRTTLMFEVKYNIQQLARI